MKPENSNTIITNPITRYFFGTVDSRPIAVFRILLSLMVLKNAIYHLVLSRWFYSDKGIVPRVALFNGLVRDTRFSLMDAIGQDWLAALFFLCWIAVLLGLLLGWRSRLMAVLNFVIVLSVHERNGYVLTGADTAIRVFSFWMMFAPIAQYYALDALKRKSPPKPAFALPVRMLQWQLIIIYCSTAFLKTLEPVWTEGQVLHYVLQLDSILLPVGYLLRQFPDWMLVTLSQFTIIVEILIPLLLAFPFRKWFIALAFTLGLMLHGGIGLALAIPDFSLVMLIAYVAHFPASWFIRWEKNTYRLLRNTYIRHSLRWLLNHTPTPLQPFPHYRKVLSAILIPLMALVIWWNAVEVSLYADDYGYDALPLMPEPLENVIWYTGLWQWWDLFAPLPIQYDGFLIIPGHFEHGITYDLRTQQPIPDRELFPRFGPMMRFEKLEENLERYHDEPILLWYGRYYCRMYNTESASLSGTRLLTLEIVFVFQNSYPPGGEPNPYQEEVLWYHDCLG